MRVLMLSWEYPPAVVGGLGRHVEALSVALAAAGHEVVVVTRHSDGAALVEERDGVRVVRAVEDPPVFPFETELLAWTMAFNHALLRTALRACEGWVPDVVHAHDWLVAHAGKAVKDALGVPLVATLHATEAGRHQGWLPGPLNRTIHTVEWWLTYEARRVLTCSGHMRWEVTRLFDLPPDKVDVLGNGVRGDDWRPAPGAVAATRSRWGGAPLVVFAGRLEYEKGVQTLLHALRRLRRRHPGVRLVVAGSGTHADALRAEARRLRLGRAVAWAGQLDQADLAALYATADVAVVPSLYEPFGLVALEAAAAGAATVLAAAGGLRELPAAARFAPGDVADLVAAVDGLLADEVRARRLAREVRAALSAYSWASIAERTADTYARAVREERELRARTVPPLRMVVPPGNLLTGERA